MKERNVSIDILKCLAAILITNSHMDMLYGKYDVLATGGAFGDVLFFFCSGYTLFLKPMNSISEFPDWYKRRINRIYPTVFSVAILACTFFGNHNDINTILIHGGGWFVSCIMLYYIGIFITGVYFMDKLKVIALLVVAGSAIWFYSVYKNPDFTTLYSPEQYIRWLLFFIFMLFGAKLGSKQNVKSKPAIDVLLLLVSIGSFYAIFIASTKISSLRGIQFLSFIPLLCAVYYFYKVCASKQAEKVYKSKVGFFLIRFIGGLCLEIYLVQHYLFTDKMNNIFPLNLIIMFAVIVIAAYVTRCFARFISQTFKDNPYDWKKIIEWY